MQKGIEVMAIILEPANIRPAKNGETFTPVVSVQIQQSARDEVDRFLGSKADAMVSRPATLELARQLLAAILEEVAEGNKTVVFAQSGAGVAEFVQVGPPAIAEPAAPALVP